MNLKDEATRFRSLINIPDDNGFVTIFVTQFLAEALENTPSLPANSLKIFTIPPDFMIPL